MIGEITNLEKRIKRQIKGKNHEFFAVVQPGFEEITELELRSLGIENIISRVEGGIEFTGKLEDCYNANLSSRIISAIYMRITSFQTSFFSSLKNKIAAVPWELYLNPEYGISISTTVRKSKLIHTGRIAEETIKGIQTHIPIKSEKNKLIETQEILIRGDNDIFQISLNSTGEGLYKRGYKAFTVKAPIRETTAAAILLLSEIKKYDVIIDPMCGSGTFSIEALQILNCTAPGSERKFSFMLWPSYRQSAYNHLLKTSGHQKTFSGKIFTSDIDYEAVITANKNILSAGVGKILSAEKLDFFKEIIPLPADKKCLIVLNPPYGKRLNAESAENIYRKIGKTIREKYSSCGYAIITPSVEMEKIMSLPYDKKIMFKNGGINTAVVIKSS
jgi:putative N6-adenine-specific DNA methylase